MRVLSSLILLSLIVIPVSGRAVENCTLQNYIQHRANISPSKNIPTREVLFAVPVPGDSSITVTRLLSSPASSPRLKELFAFTGENRIILTKGDAPRMPGEDQATTYIGIPESAMRSEEALTNHIEVALISYTNVPLNLERIPEQSRRLVLQMREKHNTTFIHARDDQGFSLDKQNTVGIKTRHVDNLRVNDVVIHEITHTTTDRKVIEAFNPVEGRVPSPFTEALAGREMSFKSKFGKSLNHKIEGYEKYYRSDEVEAHLREMAQAKLDGQDLTKQLQDTNKFINSEEAHIRSLLKNNGNDLTVVHGDAEDALRAGRRQRRIVTGPENDFELSILVPRGLDQSGEREFIASALRRRLETLSGYRQGLQRYQ